MANNKTSFEYYTVDTDRYLDMKIKRLKQTYHCNGIAVYDYILCECYRDKGCYIDYDSNRAFDIADYFGLKETTVNEIVNFCCSCGLFNKYKFESEHIITSASIQRRYAEMCQKAKRKDCIIPNNVRIIPEQSEIIPEESEIPPEESQQSKVKYSKVKYISDARTCAREDTDTERENFLKIFFFNKRLKAPGLFNEIDRFVNHYSATSWINAQGQEITDKLAVAANWDARPNLPRLNDDFLSRYRQWFDYIAEKEGEEKALTLITGFTDVTSTDDAICLTVTGELHDLLERNIIFIAKSKIFSRIDYHIVTKIVHR